MTIPLPTWLICESCGLRGRAYQFPPDKTKPERRNRSTTCYECWHKASPISRAQVGDRVKLRATASWGENDIKKYDGKLATVIDVGVPSLRMMNVELFGGVSDGFRVWMSFDEMEPAE